MTKIPSTSQASFIKGLWFIFRDGDREIAAHGSTLGQERIFVNGKLVSQKRSLSKKSTHQFIFEGNMYEIMFIVSKTSSTEMECSLTRDNICVGIFKTYYKQASTVKSPIKIFFNIILGLIIGMLMGTFGGLFGILFKIPLMLTLIPSIVIGLIVYFNRIKPKSTMVVERVDV
jgi:hypothetical protein